MSARTIRVGLLVPNGLDGKGGIERLSLYMHREFQRAIPDISLRPLLTRTTDGALLKHLAAIPALLRFARACRRAEIDIAHINVAPRGSTWRKMLFARVARRAGIKTVIHLHGSGYDQFYAGQSSTAKAAIRRLFQRADAVVVLGAHWRAFAERDLQVPASRLHVIANGVPEPATASTDDQGAAPLIVTMGAVGERKGTDVLIDALAALPTDLAWQAAIGGNGDLGTFEARAAAAGIGDKVRFLGWVGETEVDLWLRRASIFVLPSRAENQPMAILEAMARGVPVVATRIGAIPEQVVDGETGMLVPPGDADALHGALETLLASDALRERMGAAGRERYAAHFSIAACAQSFANLYRALAGADERKAA